MAITPSVLQPAIIALDPHEVLYFDRFRDVVIRQLAYETDGPPEFWLRTVLRESTRDRCVLHAIVAIGALSQAQINTHTHVPLYNASLPGFDRTSQHYYESVRSYAKALKAFRNYISGDRRETPQRTILITTMLVTVFELLQGNTDAVDNVTATCIRALKDSLLPTDDSLRASRIAATIDDDGVEDAEMWLTRRVALCAVSSPIYPRGRESILTLAGPIILGPEPPGGDQDLSAYFRAWCLFFNSSIFWYLRVKDVFSAALGSTTLEMLVAEQSLLLGRCAAWESATRSRLSQTSHSIEVLGNQIIFMGAKVLGYCILCCFDITGSTWKMHRSRWQEIEALSRLILENLSLSPSQSTSLRDSVSFGLLQPARDCRYSGIRNRAMDLCRLSLVPESSHDMRLFVLGTFAVVSVEAAHSDAEGLIPLAAVYDWTSAFWNDELSKLHVTLTPRFWKNGAKDQKRLTVNRNDWTIIVEE